MLNRCLVLSVAEDRAQTRAIHERQREAQTIEGILGKNDRQRIIKLHQNAQRLLRPLLVANNFARELKFADHRTRSRRDHGKYLALIRAIALLHQYQRPVKTAEHHGEIIEYIEVEKRDIEIADRLAADVLCGVIDDLSPQTRRMLEMVGEMVKTVCAEKSIERGQYRFTRREVREVTGCSDFQVQKHLTKLTQMEYLAVHRGNKGSQFVYELCEDAEKKEGGQSASTQSFKPLTHGLMPTYSPLIAGYSTPEKSENPQENQNPAAKFEPLAGKHVEGASQNNGIVLTDGHVLTAEKKKAAGGAR